jgi:hypothetical protein
MLPVLGCKETKHADLILTIIEVIVVGGIVIAFIIPIFNS